MSSATAPGGHLNGYTDDKDAYLKRMRRIEGQVRGIAKMIENDQHCIDVLTQVSAATKALQAVALGLLDEHLKHCVTQAAAESGGRGRGEGRRGQRRDRPPRQVLNSTTDDLATTQKEPTTFRHTYAVTGMTCEHRVASATEEISEIDGVTEAAVDLPAGAVTVAGTTPVGGADVRAAVEKSGYRLAGAQVALCKQEGPDMNTAATPSTYGAALALLVAGGWGPDPLSAPSPPRTTRPPRAGTGTRTAPPSRRSRPTSPATGHPAGPRIEFVAEVPTAGGYPAVPGLPARRRRGTAEFTEPEPPARHTDSPTAQATDRRWRLRR